LAILHLNYIGPLIFAHFYLILLVLIQYLCHFNLAALFTSKTQKVR